MKFTINYGSGVPIGNDLVGFPVSQGEVEINTLEDLLKIADVTGGVVFVPGDERILPRITMIDCYIECC